MSSLLQISIGPVQSFIAASRKTRDLAVGSRLLSVLAKKAAEVLHAAGAELIFPPSVDAPAANILLAEVHCNPAQLAENAKAQVIQELKRLVAEAAKHAGALPDPNANLDEQAERLLEWFAVWTPLQDGNYAIARQRVGALMAGRKALRDFLPACSEPLDGKVGRPKSPLDPAFAGVLKVDERTWKVVRGNDVRVKEREHLDAVGLVKRFGRLPETSDRFPSTREVALASFLEKSDRALLSDLQARLAGYEDVADVGDVLFDDLDDLPPNLKPELRDLAKRIKKDQTLRAYYAVIHADGDAMGKLIDSLARDGQAKHREFSEELSAFASRVPQIVEEHLGTLIYAGGDDVVALVSLDKSVALAHGLWAEFNQIARWAKIQVPDLSPLPSLTVGVGAVHILDNLQEAVGFARSLEKRGKTEIFRRDGEEKMKNALCVGARPRGGADICAVGRWDDNFHHRFETHRKSLQTYELPRGYPFEVRRFGEEISRLQSSENRLETEALKGFINAEVRRIVARKQTVVAYNPPELKDEHHLKRYSEMLIVAHFFSREGTI